MTYDLYVGDRTFSSWSLRGGPCTMGAEVAQGPSENETCPYSGDAVTDFLRIDDRVFGFCNPFCRDKTLADPAAWPEFMALYSTANC